MTPVKVEVTPTLVELTQRHIGAGLARNCNACPWANAIREHLNKRSAVQVGSDNILFTRIGQEDFYVLQPKEMYEWIEVFDEWKAGIIGPTSAVIDIPDWALTH